MNTLPLLPPAPPNAVLALHEGREISRALFLQHVAEVAGGRVAGLDPGVVVHRADGKGALLDTVTS